MHTYMLNAHEHGCIHSIHSTCMYSHVEKVAIRASDVLDRRGITGEGARDKYIKEEGIYEGLI